MTRAPQRLMRAPCYGKLENAAVTASLWIPALLSLPQGRALITFGAKAGDSQRLADLKAGEREHQHERVQLGAPRSSSP